MKRAILFGFLISLCGIAKAQVHKSLSSIPDTCKASFRSIKLAQDSLSSSFVVIIKDEVKLHKHLYHTESIYIVEGTGILKLGDSIFTVIPGDYICVPKNTPHSVIVTSQKPMKVLSIQAPYFDGTDRVFIK